MDIPQVKRLAASIMKCGVSKIRVIEATEATQAMTKDDVRDLIRRNVIIELPKKGVSRSRAKKISQQKKKGKQKGKGSRKGKSTARMPKKKRWMTKVRAQRKMLKQEREGLVKGAYRKVYNMIKGGYFRTKSHLQNYINEKDMRKK